MSGLFGSDSWLYIILIGFFVGLLGRFFMPGNNRMGCLLTILLGIAGAVFAGWFGREMGWYAAGQPAGFLGAILGAVVLLALLRLISGGKRR
ncbi:MAG: GlsB/YeaQ/YmgE family stress response membrane protein [Stenotrophomonas sp.]|uniref:GlsB/YeaQ/YmgE family stress response membrane protein n=1 Tax=Stenotrophomonas sp. TaxID=69392 RepID=UPI0028AB0E2A|nr:GlsB/YeaQ/YmgE family stress response membrane protein [Stenotrophomonas sp.]